jgi:hypothetical protein
MLLAVFFSTALLFAQDARQDVSTLERQFFATHSDTTVPLHHSTVIIDGKKSERTTARVREWHQENSFDLLSVEYDEPSTAQHTRTIFYARQKHYFVIIDHLNPNINSEGTLRQEHTYTFLMHVDAPHTTVENGTFDFYGEHTGLLAAVAEVSMARMIAVQPANAVPNNLVWRSKDTLTLNLQTAEVTKVTNSSEVFITCLVPYKERKPTVICDRLADCCSDFARITIDGKTEWFGMRKPQVSKQTISNFGIQTDAEYFFIAENGQGYAVDGTSLKVNGKDVVR